MPTEAILSQLHELATIDVSDTAMYQSLLKAIGRVVEAVAPQECRILLLDQLSSTLLAVVEGRETAIARKRELEESIKKAVLEVGSTVKSNGLVALIYNGRVTYDAKQMDVYADTHPEVLRYRKKGNDYVAIRKATEE